MRTRAELKGTLEDIPPDANVRIEAVAGAKNGEPAVVVTSAGGARTSLLIADAIQNNSKGSLGLLPRLCGFAGGPKVVPIFKMMFLSDKKALKSQLDQWAELPGLARVIPCHGDPVTAGPRRQKRPRKPTVGKGNWMTVPGCTSSGNTAAFVTST
jgi:hypothetical protein